MAAVALDLTNVDRELFAEAMELIGDIAEHLPHRAYFESIEMLGEVAEALARIATAADQ